MSPADNLSKPRAEAILHVVALGERDRADLFRKLLEQAGCALRVQENVRGIIGCKSGVCHVEP